MNKYQTSEVKSFEFADLKGQHVVGGQADFKSFSFKTLDGSGNETKISDEEVRKERSFEKKNNFKIDDQVRELRGLNRQEASDVEKQIQAEVEKRLSNAYNDAIQEGIEKGRAEGKAAALAEFQEALSQKIEDFTQVITQVQNQTQSLVAKNQDEVYEFIKRFTKWIVMKEINEKTYLENLLEKLILELNVRKNLIVKVGRANFAQMPEVISVVEARLGALSNVRVEIVPQIVHPGIILEAENSLIDGTLEGVFANIDKIFETVVPRE